MVDVPKETLVTNPLDEPIVATAVLLLDHVPPDVASDKVVEAPIVHTPKTPVIADKALTVITFVAIHPVDEV